MFFHLFEAHLTVYYYYLIRAQPSHKKEEKKSDKQSEKDKNSSKNQEAKNKSSDSVSSNTAPDSSKKDDKKHTSKSSLWSQYVEHLCLVTVNGCFLIKNVFFSE